jgi:hypothetical protein
MHPFVLPFAVLAVADLLIVLAAACLRTRVSSDKPLAFHAIAAWAVVVLVANAANRLALPPAGIVLAVVVTMGGLMIAWRAPLAPAQVRQALTAQRVDVAMVLATLGLQTALYLVPLAAVFPTHTLVTGNFVCNDSVAHAVLMRGFDVVHGLYGAWTHYSIYPDAFHAVMFGLRGVLPADGPSYLLPASIWAASFFGLPMLMLVDVERAPGRLASVLVAASPAAALLLGTSVYLFFIGQMAVLPLVAAAVVIIASWTPGDLRGARVLLPLVIAGAALASYGLIAVSLIAFAVGLRLSAAVLRHRGRVWRVARAAIVEMMQRSSWIAAAVVAVLVAPALWQIYQGYAFFSTRTISFGNLFGLLSPLHVTGFWQGGLDYRVAIAHTEHAAALVLAVVLAVEIVLVVRARISRAALIVLLTFGVPVAASAALVPGPYINFKFLTFFTGVWIAMVSLAIVRAAGALARGRTWVAPVALAIVMAVMVSTPLKSFRRFPALTDRWFHAIAELRASHLSRGAVLILSPEDWFQYYRDADDIAPMTTYFHQIDDGRTMDEILVDDKFERQALDALRGRWPDARQRLGDCQGTTLDGRFRVYAFLCVAGVRP